MKRQTQLKKCSILPDYPKKAYTICIFMCVKDLTMVLPVHRVFKDIKDADIEIKNYFEMQEIKDKGIDLPHQTILIPIKFKRLIRLYPKYWKGQQEELRFENRLLEFTKLINKSSFYDLLVVPTYYDKLQKKFELNAVIPLKVGISDPEIGNFMQHCGFPVNESASHVALYSIGGLKRYDFDTKVIDIPEKNIKTNKSQFPN